jgi:preprotein translocase subunit SecA
LIPPLAEVTVESLRGLSGSDVTDRLAAAAIEAYEKREAEMNPDTLREVERLVLLQTIDRKWIDHLHNMDALREGIGLRAYAQVSPLIEYQREGYDMFQATLKAIQEETVRMLYRVQIAPQEPMVARPVARPVAPAREPAGVGARGNGQAKGGHVKLGRNDPCWCGSGKKYKKCHGREV